MKLSLTGNPGCVADHDGLGVAGTAVRGKCVEVGIVTSGAFGNRATGGERLREDGRAPSPRSNEAVVPAEVDGRGKT